jgi:hypothetical protein
MVTPTIYLTRQRAEQADRRLNQPRNKWHRFFETEMGAVQTLAGNNSGAYRVEEMGGLVYRPPALDTPGRTLAPFESPRAGLFSAASSHE